MNIEHAIWSSYVKNPCRLFSIRELSLYLNKSYPLIHQHVTRLIKEQKLSSQVVGKSILCYPNLNNSYALLQLALAQEAQTKLLLTQDSSSRMLHQFFSTQQLKGVLSIWKTASHELVLFIADDSYKKSIEEVLSKTTLNMPIIFVTFSSLSSALNELIQAEIIFFGYEQFYHLIRLEYSSYASTHNLVKLHE